MIEPRTLEAITRFGIVSSEPAVHPKPATSNEPSDPAELLTDIQSHVDALKDSATAASERSGHLDAIRTDVGRIRAFVNQLHVDESAAPELATPGAAPPAPSRTTLTRRELEVLRLIGRGLARKQIAAALFLSVKTIDAHQAHILRKLGVESRMDLVRFAIRAGLAQV